MENLKNNNKNNYLKGFLFTLLIIPLFLLYPISDVKAEETNLQSIEEMNIESTFANVGEEIIKSSKIKNNFEPQNNYAPKEKQENLHNEIIENNDNNEKVEIKEEVVEEIKEEIIFTVEDIEEIRYATTNVNIRELPSANATRLGALSFAQEIKVTGNCDNGWARVEYNGNVAYINSKYLSLEKPIIVEQPTQPIVTNNNEYNGAIRYDEGVSINFVKKVDSYYLLIPENVRIHFNNSGWIMLISKESLGPRVWGQNISVLGTTCYDEHVIYIDNRDKAAPCITHEFGHYIDYSLGFISESEEFINIYNAERNTFCSVHSTHANNTNTYMEYFAESYQVMLTNPQLLQTYCPQTYAFLQQCSNSL